MAGPSEYLSFILLSSFILFWPNVGVKAVYMTEPQLRLNYGVIFQPAKLISTADSVFFYQVFHIDIPVIPLKMLARH